MIDYLALMAFTSIVTVIVYKEYLILTLESN